MIFHFYRKIITFKEYQNDIVQFTIVDDKPTVIILDT